MSKSMTKAEEFISCVSTNNFPYAQKMLGDGEVDINSTYCGDSILIESASRGDIRIVEWALKNGADVNYGEIPALHRAAQHGHLDCIKALINANAHIGSTKLYPSAAFFALESGYIEIYRYLDQMDPDKTFENSEAFTWSNIKAMMINLLRGPNRQELLYVNKSNIIHLLHNGTFKKSFFPISKRTLKVRKEIEESVASLTERERIFLMSAWEEE
jgi:ankyrin repeat protein